jgi:hypothetical protein
MQHGHEQGRAACRHLSTVNAHVHASCQCPSCMSMSMLYVLVHAACSNPCSMDMDMQQDMTCSKDMGMHHGNGMPHILRHAAWTLTSSIDMDCSIDMGMQHGDGHVASIIHVCIHVYVHVHCRYGRCLVSRPLKKFFSSHLV